MLAACGASKLQGRPAAFFMGMAWIWAFIFLRSRNKREGFLSASDKLPPACARSHTDRGHPLGLGIDSQCRRGERDAIGHACILAVQALQPLLSGQRAGQR
jgi:hypothetical protein